MQSPVSFDKLIIIIIIIIIIILYYICRITFTMILDSNVYSCLNDHRNIIYCKSGLFIFNDF